MSKSKGHANTNTYTIRKQKPAVSEQAQENNGEAAGERAT